MQQPKLPWFLNERNKKFLDKIPIGEKIEFKRVRLAGGPGGCCESYIYYKGKKSKLDQNIREEFSIIKR